MWTDPRLAAVHHRVRIWFGFWIIAGVCGLNLFDRPTLFWVSVITAIYISKEDRR